MKNLKEMPTPQIMSYIEATLQIRNILENTGRQAAICFQNEGMDEVRMNQIHGHLEEKIMPVQKSYYKLTDEMDRRLKRDLGLAVGFNNADKTNTLIVKDNPFMLCGKDEIAMLKAEQAQKKKDNLKNKKSKGTIKLNPKK